jgi:hypothetical protein
LQDPHFNRQKLDMVTHTHLSFQWQWEASNRRNGGQGWPEQKARPYLKHNQSKKRTGGTAPVVEHLSSKCEALSSKPQYHQEKKNNYILSLK